MAVHDRLKFIEELNNVKELTLASPYVNKHVVKYIDILIAIYDKEVKQYEDDMWEEYMSNSVNDAVKEDLYEEGLELGLTGEELLEWVDDQFEQRGVQEHMSKKRNPTYHSFHENFTPDLWKNAKKELEEKTTVFDENDFEENNYEDLCTHEDWTDEDDMRYHQWELERKLDQVDLELQHEKLMG